MGTLRTALPTLATATTAVAPTIGRRQAYDATVGNLAPALPLLSAVPRDGAIASVQKSPADLSQNVITITCSGSDTFDDGTTTATLKMRGELRDIETVTISGTRYWKITGGNTGLTPLLGAAQVPRLVAPAAPRKWLTTFAAGHGFVHAGTGTQTDDTAVKLLGAQSLRLDTNGAAGTDLSKLSGIAAMDFTGLNVIVRLQVSAIAHLTFARVTLGDNSLANSIAFDVKPPTPGSNGILLDGESIDIMLPWSLGAVTGTPNRAAITAIAVSAADDGVSAVSVNFGGVGITPVAPGYPAGVGVASWFLDDCYLNHYTQVLPVLEANGQSVCFGVIASVVDGADHTSAQMTVAQLQAAQLHGHEIGGHAYSLSMHGSGG